MPAIALRDPVASLNLTDNEVSFYRQEGYLYIPSLLSRGDAAALRDEVVQTYEALGMPYEALRRATKTGDKLHQSGEYLVASRLETYIHSPRLLAIAARLMEGESTLYMAFTAVKNGGGGGRFHFHQDNQY